MKASPKFDHELVEHTFTTDYLNTVEVYKVGGGTWGQSYEGFWGFRLSRGEVALASGESLHTGTPKNHAQVAILVAEIFETEE